jgi:hypothetical protein
MAKKTLTVSDQSGAETDGLHKIVVSGPDWTATMDVTKEEAEEMASGVERKKKKGRKAKDATPEAAPLKDA